MRGDGALFHYADFITQRCGVGVSIHHGEDEIVGRYDSLSNPLEVNGAIWCY